jgi:hypothetical protein
MVAVRRAALLAVAAGLIRGTSAQYTDACGCQPGTGWSLTTGRGCCKTGSVTQLSEQAGCAAALGNTDCATGGLGGASMPDACGCPIGFGWSISTGRLRRGPLVTPPPPFSFIRRVAIEETNRSEE